MKIDIKKTVNQIHDERMTLGQKVADAVASGMGSWPYIIIQSVIVVFWIILNCLAGFVWKWDLPPFILLNLIFSTQASYAAPIIMMSQNRQSTKDRIAAEHDYATNEAAKTEIESLLQMVIAQNEHLDKQDAMILQIVQRLEARKR